jgi:hypothetical protein
MKHAWQNDPHRPGGSEEEQEKHHAARRDKAAARAGCVVDLERLVGQGCPVCSIAAAGPVSGKAMRRR